MYAGFILFSNNKPLLPLQDKKQKLKKNHMHIKRSISILKWPLQISSKSPGTLNGFNLVIAQLEFIVQRIDKQGALSYL